MTSIQWKKLAMLKIFWNDALSNTEKENSLNVLSEYMPEDAWNEAMSDSLRLGLRVA